MRPSLHRPTFAAHAVLAAAGIVAALWHIWKVAPLEIDQIGSSYLIFFFHFPSAVGSLEFFFLAALCGAWNLWKRGRVSDAASASAVEVGLLAAVVTLVTGSTWAKAAWGHWWVWDDPRLLSVAIMTITYLGYHLLRSLVDEPEKRARFCSVFSIVALVSVGFVHYAIKLLGKVSHPMKPFQDPSITQTRIVAWLAFLVLYLLLFRIRFAQARAALAIEDLRQRAEDLR